MHDTVEAHILSGTLTLGGRTSVSALEIAATWLLAYEGDPTEDTNMQELATVANWLIKEAKRRSS